MFWLRNKKIIFRYAHLSGGVSQEEAHGSTAATVQYPHQMFFWKKEQISSRTILSASAIIIIMTGRQ